ncbi:MAG: acetylhydrolase [Roseateles depolymerans]|uniref:Acetylhydrolase n=1 Tax=Roseateles depolymerans TaxID=76731 RepID=A0A2W5DEW7_9BURK|nr:MAG: acetylhydrolase [Roseateles depolymerans]
MSNCSDPARRRLAQALGAALALGALGVGPAQARDIEPASLPPVDPDRYQAIDLDLTDPARARAVPQRLYLPVVASDAASVPLLLFSHGMGGSRRGYRYLGSWLASQGVAALHVQHVGSDRELWFGNPFGLVGRLQDAAQEREAVARVHDVRFALDQLLAGEWAARLDARRIVACGHSYGANTTLLLAGARVQRGGQALDLREPRLRAAIAISAPPFYGEADPAAILSAVQLPTLHITATEDVIPIPGYRSPASDRVEVFEAMGGPAWLAMFQGGSHSIFTDRVGTGGLALNPQVKAATRELVLAFLANVLDGQPGALQRWPAQWQAILAQWQVSGVAA